MHSLTLFHTQTLLDSHTVNDVDGSVIKLKILSSGAI